MSVPKWLKVSHQQVFPHRAFVVSDVTAVIDYERSTKDNKVQATDRDSEPSPSSSQHPAACVPANSAGTPFTPVIFEELCVLPYVDSSSESGRIAWSFRASGMTADTGKGAPQPETGCQHESVRPRST